jgi:hypothetical protein
MMPLILNVLLSYDLLFPDDLVEILRCRIPLGPCLVARLTSADYQIKPTGLVSHFQRIFIGITKAGKCVFYTKITPHR